MFSRYLVMVKIIKIRQLKGHISYINQDIKTIFTKRNTILLQYMYQVFSSLQGHLYFFVHFSSLLWNNFLWETDIHVFFNIECIVLTKQPGTPFSSSILHRAIHSLTYDRKCRNERKSSPGVDAYVVQGIVILHAGSFLPGSYQSISQL